MKKKKRAIYEKFTQEMTIFPMSSIKYRSPRENKKASAVNANAPLNG
jgi:hypothetical protein